MNVHKVSLAEVVSYLDGYLRVPELTDFPQAHNGLQVENSGSVRRLAVAVDAAEATIRAAVGSGADLLIVHHGLFWDANPRVTGRRFTRLRLLLESDVAVYSAHLPLDVHPDVGNNRVLAAELGIEYEGDFGDYKGAPVGIWGTLDVRREALAARLDQVLGSRVRMVAAGPERIHTVGVLTGGGGGHLPAAASLGLDAFITGEGTHHNYFDAEEAGINLYLGGHYATEVWGVRALGRHLGERFGLPWTFIDYATGL